MVGFNHSRNPKLASHSLQLPTTFRQIAVDVSLWESTMPEALLLDPKTLANLLLRLTWSTVVLRSIPISRLTPQEAERLS